MKMALWFQYRHAGIKGGMLFTKIFSFLHILYHLNMSNIQFPFKSFKVVIHISITSNTKTKILMI